MPRLAFLSGEVPLPLGTTGLFYGCLETLKNKFKMCENWGCNSFENLNGVVSLIYRWVSLLAR